MWSKQYCSDESEDYIVIDESTMAEAICTGGDEMSVYSTRCTER